LRESIENARYLFKARQTCLWIYTIEEEEVIRDIRDLVSQEIPNAKLYVWSNTEGVKHIPFRKSEAPEPVDIKLREVPALFASIRDRLTKDDTCVVYVLRDFHNLLGDPRTRRCVRDIAEYAQKKYIPLIVISPVTEIHSEIAHLFKTVDYGLPTEQQLAEITHAYNTKLAEKINKEGRSDLICLGSKEEEQEVVNACKGLTIKEVKDLFAQSLQKYKSFNLAYLLQHKIEMVKKSGLLDWKQPQISLNDIGGHSDLKNYLLEIKEQLTPEARNFGLPAPKGALFLGLAGCGKTMTAEAFAGTLGVPMLSLSMSRIMSRFVGESENKIDQALSIVRSVGNCVLLLDEVEKMLGGNC